MQWDSKETSFRKTKISVVQQEQYDIDTLKIVKFFSTISLTKRKSSLEKIKEHLKCIFVQLVIKNLKQKIN